MTPIVRDRLKPCIALVANDRPLPCLPMERRWKDRKERERPGAGNIQQHAKDRRRPSREKTRRSPKKKVAGRKEVECRGSGKQERERQHTRNGHRRETKSEHGADLPRVNCQSAKPSTEPFRGTLSRIVMGLCQAWLSERPHTLMVEAQLPEVTSPHGCDAQLGNRNPPSCCAAQQPRRFSESQRRRVGSAVGLETYKYLVDNIAEEEHTVSDIQWHCI